MFIDESILKERSTVQISTQNKHLLNIRVFKNLHVTQKMSIGPALPKRFKGLRDCCIARLHDCCVARLRDKCVEGCMIVALQGCVIVVLQGCMIVALQGCMIFKNTLVSLKQLEI
jgi:hypothetical protein